MVTKDGDHPIGFVVRIEFLLDGSVVRSLLVELNLESLRGVEGTEDLRGKPLHVPIEVSIQLGGLSNVGGVGQVLVFHGGGGMKTHVDTIEKSIIIRLILLEDSHVLEHLRVHLDLLEVPDRVFTQEVEAENIGGLQSDVFTTE